MLEIIQTFLRKTEEHDHVLQLIKGADSVVVCLVTDQDKISLLLKDGKITLLKDSRETNQYEIYGDPQAFRQLLTGREKLRSLIAKGQISLSAPFRFILMLESLFYLTKWEEKKPSKLMSEIS